VDATRRATAADLGGRRNLSPAARAYFLGSEYDAKKKAAGGTGANQHNRQSKAAAQGGKNCHAAKTADKLAKQQRVSERTIRNHALFAQAVDQIVANCGDNARDVLLAASAKVRQEHVIRLAGLAPAVQRRAIDELTRTGRWKGPAKARTSPTPKSQQRTRPSESGSTPTPGLTVLSGADLVELADRLMGLLGPKKFAGLHRAMTKVLASGHVDMPANSMGTTGRAAGAARRKTRPAAAGAAED
jgi:hypothetical protein